MAVDVCRYEDRVCRWAVIVQCIQTHIIIFGQICGESIFMIFNHVCYSITVYILYDETGILHVFIFSPYKSGAFKLTVPFRVIYSPQEFIRTIICCIHSRRNQYVHQPISIKLSKQYVTLRTSGFFQPCIGCNLAWSTCAAGNIKSVYIHSTFINMAYISFSVTIIIHDKQLVRIIGSCLRVTLLCTHEIDIIWKYMALVQDFIVCQIKEIAP